MKDWKQLDFRKILVPMGVIAAWFGFAFLISRVPLHPSMFSDWPYFYKAGQMLLDRQPLYAFSESGFLFYNPPWVAVILVPLSLFPPVFGAGLITAISVTVILLLSRKYHLSLFSTAMLLLSPPVINVMSMGQIDLLILGGLLLPAELAPIVAVSKPQTAIGFAFTPFFNGDKLKRVILVSGGVLLASVLVFGFWFFDILSMHTPEQATWNLWRNIWPWNLVVGIPLIGLGLYKKNELILLAASPFLFPYTTLGGFVGGWLAVHQRGKTWEILGLFSVSWAVVLWLILG